MSHDKSLPGLSGAQISRLQALMINCSSGFLLLCDFPVKSTAHIMHDKRNFIDKKNEENVYLCTCMICCLKGIGETAVEFPTVCYWA